MLNGASNLMCHSADIEAMAKSGACVQSGPYDGRRVAGRAGQEAHHPVVESESTTENPFPRVLDPRLYIFSGFYNSIMNAVT
jgi:hypothetical protein